MIIDKKLAKFKDVPATLNGEVLLERTVDAKGKVNGYLTAPVADVRAHKGKTLAALQAIGWDKYKTIIDTV